MHIIYLSYMFTHTRSEEVHENGDFLQDAMRVQEAGHPLLKTKNVKQQEHLQTSEMNHGGT